MLASMVVSRMQHLIKCHGDREVFLDVGPNGLLSIGEIDVDTEDIGVIVWPKGAGE